MSTQLLDEVLGSLAKTKGRWRTVANESGIPYDTICKIAQGKTPNPGVLTVQALADYFHKQKKRRTH